MSTDRDFPQALVDERAKVRPAALEAVRAALARERATAQDAKEGGR